MNKGVDFLVILSLLIGLLTGAYSQNDNKITVQSGPVKVKKGEIVSLWCKLKTDAKHVMMPVHWQSPPTFKTRTANCDSFKEEKYVISCSKTGRTFRFFNLTIKDVQFVDEGSYRCIHGRHIDLVYLSPFVPVTDVTLTYEIRNKPTEPLFLNAIITCTTNCAYPEPKISWFENDQPFRGKATVTVTDVGCTGLKEGQKRTRSTVIVHVNKDQKEHIINCTAENVIGEKAISKTKDVIYSRSYTAQNDVTTSPPQPVMTAAAMTAAAIGASVAVPVVVVIAIISAIVFIRKKRKRRRSQTHMRASAEGNDAFIDALCKNKVEIDKVNEDGLTKLMNASKNGLCHVVNALLSGGADVNRADENGRTALMMASKNDNPEVVECLLIYQAEVNKQDENGWTALMIASKIGSPKVVECLLKYKAEVNKQLKNGLTALMIASKRGSPKVVEYLLKYKAEVNKQLKNGWTALMIASKRGNPRVVESLLKYNAEVNKQLKEGETALMIASNEGHIEVVDDLLEAGAYVNEQKKNGWTALMIASNNSDQEVVDSLLKYDAEVDKQSKVTHRKSSTSKHS
ncbi:ankyrin repeat and KH domain-containing protein 1-like [Lineus longissimus]|uniref:ankyrin repeat and KH domain-containing protein 1-like n=1 Tax=Lineus longissimus TaxID=88925 RepID=UPI00315DCC2A